MICYVAYNVKTGRLVGVYETPGRAKTRVSQLVNRSRIRPEWVEEVVGRSTENPEGTHVARWIRGDYCITRVEL